MIVDIYIISTLALGVLIGSLLGMWRGIMKSTVSAVTTLLSVAAAFPLSLFAVKSAILPALANEIDSGSLIPELAGFIGSSNALAMFAEIIGSFLLFPLCFSLVFLALKLVLLIPSAITKTVLKLTALKNTKKTWKSRGIGIAINAVSGFVIAAALIFPVYTYSGLSYAAVNNEGLSDITEDVDELLYDNGIAISITDIEAPVCSSFYETFSKPCLSIATACEYKGETADVYSFGAAFVPLCTALESFTDAVDEDMNLDIKKAAEPLTETVNAVFGNGLVRDVFTDSVSFFSEKLKNGEEVFGLTRQSLEESASGEYSTALDEMLCLLAEIDEKFSVLDTASEAECQKEFDDYGIIISNAADFLVSIVNAGEAESATELLDAMDAEAVGTALETLNQTLVFKGDGCKLIDLVFNMDVLNTDSFRGSELAPSLKAALERGDGSFAATLEAARRTAVIAVVLSADETDETVIAEHLEWLAVNMDETVAETVKSAVTSSAFAQNMPENAASAMSDAMNLLCDSLASLKDMSQEESVTETAALRKLYNMWTSLSSGNAQDGIFSEESGSASELVDSICSSKLISNVIEKLVYAEDGSIKDKPLGFETAINSNDEAALIAALEARRSDTDIKLLSAIAALFGTKF